MKLEIIKISSEFVAGFSNFEEEKLFDRKILWKSRNFQVSGRAGDNCKATTTKDTKLHEGRMEIGRAAKPATPRTNASGAT
jgi:hypothetical protein